ncbi:S8 family serine peptidase [Bacteroidota bacterium]
MKYTTIFLLLLLSFSIKAQEVSTANNITEDLLEFISQSSDNELIPINIMLSEKYPSDQLISKSSHMNKEERRSFVVSELKAFSKQSQYNISKYLSDKVLTNEVEEVHNFWITNVISCKASKEVINELSLQGNIDRIDHDEVRYLLIGEQIATPAQPLQTPGAKEITPNVIKVNAPDVWNLGYTGQGVVVAVLDVGVNYNHSDLEDHMWESVDYPNHGYDFAYNDNDPMDNHGHGTHCAGTVAGDGTAGSQTGMAPDAAIMAVKILNDNGGGQESHSWAGFEFAVDNGADVISFSVGWPHSYNPARSSWRNTLDNTLAAGVVAAIAAGNEGGNINNPDDVRTPGDCPPPWLNPDQTLLGGISACVCVGATDNNDNIAYFSSRGPSSWEVISPFNDYPFNPEMGLLRPDVSAPGVNIKSCNAFNVNGYTFMDGTSMATPGVAGVMALLISKVPGLTPQAIDIALETTSVDLGAVGKDNVFGAGRIDALQAFNDLVEMYSPTNLLVNTDQQTGLSSMTWSHNLGMGFLYYRIYRNSVLIDSVSVKNYEDQLLDYGYYTYEVSAVYGGSLESNRAIRNTQWGSSIFMMDPDSFISYVEPEGIDQQSMIIKNTGVLELNFSLSPFDIEDWCTIEPESGVVAVDDSLIVTIAFDAEGLGIGQYDDTLAFITNELNPTPHYFTVSMIVDMLEVNATANPLELCIGESTQLGIDIVGGTGGLSYSWTSVPEGFTSTLADPEVTPAENTIYFVSVSDDYLVKEDSVLISVHELPDVSLGDDQVLCDVTGYPLDAGNPGSTYAWSTGEDTQNITATGMGENSFWVEVIDMNGCVQSDTVLLTFAESPVVELGADTAICDDAVIILDAGNPGANYLWSTQETSKTITIDAADYSTGIHNFYVEVTNDFNCNTTDSIAIEVLNCSGINENDKNIAITVFPNPSNGIFNLELKSLKSRNVRLKVISVSGAVVYEESGINISGTFKKQLNLSKLEKGIYNVIVFDDNKVVTKKIVFDK